MAVGIAVRCRAVPVEVRPVRGRGDLKRFIRLPWRLYSNDDPWVPPLLRERRRFLDRERNPFFRHAEAEYFLAWRDGEPVGRITAHVDHRLNEFQGNRWGQFGFFECEEDPEAAHALLSVAEEWLRERRRDRMVGPSDFTTNHECGLLIEGHEHPPQILEPWQHPYYRGLLEGYGLEKAMDLIKWELWLDEAMERTLPVIWELAEKLEPEHGITIRHFRKRDLEAEIKRFLEVYNAAWERNWGFVPLTDEEVEDYARELRPVLDENWAMVAEKDGEPVGAGLTLPDYNQVLKGLNGRLLPFGWLKALRGRKKIDAVRVFALGVKPEYQHTGIAAGLYVEHYNMAGSTPQSGGEMGWVLENNTAMNRGLEAMGAKPVKRYRMYEKLFEDGAPAGADTEAAATASAPGGSAADPR
jgi:GNAT superfamily N-acetyltransferase